MEGPFRGKIAFPERLGAVIRRLKDSCDVSGAKANRVLYLTGFWLVPLAVWRIELVSSPSPLLLGSGIASLTIFVALSVRACLKNPFASVNQTSPIWRIWLSLVFVGVGLQSLTEHNTMAQLWLLALSCCALGYLLLRVPTTTDTHWFLRYAALVLVLASALGFIRFGFNYGNPAFFVFDARSALTEPWSPGRYVGFFQNFASLGVASVFILQVALRSTHWQRGIYLATALGLAVLADSRTVWAAVCVSSFFSLLDSIRCSSPRTIRRSAHATFAFTIATVYFLSYGTIDWSLNGRVVLWGQAVNVLTNREPVVTLYATSSPETQPLLSAHNTLLTLFVNGGPPVTLVFLTLLLVSLWLSWVSWLRRESFPLAFLLGFVVISVAEDTVHFNPPNLSLILLVLSTLTAYRHAFPRC